MLSVVLGRVVTSCEIVIFTYYEIDPHVDLYQNLVFLHTISSHAQWSPTVEANTKHTQATVKSTFTYLKLS